MTLRRTATEEWALDAERLRKLVLTLQREIADHLAEQQRIYLATLHPHSAEAKLLKAASRDNRYGESPVETRVAVTLTGDSPTAKFEFGRSEVARLSKLVTSKRRQLAKAEKELAHARDAVGRTPHGELNQLVRFQTYLDQLLESVR